SRPIGPAGRLWRWCRRKPALATISAAALFLMTLAGGLYLANQVENNRREKAEKGEEIAVKGRQKAEGELSGAKENAEKAKKTAEKQTKLTLQAEYPDDMRQAGEAWYPKNYARVSELLKKHAPEPGREDHRGWEWHYLKAHTPDLEAGG